jgi:hypothetical protein
MVVIGIDAHKRTHTAVVVDANGRQAPGAIRSVAARPGTAQLGRPGEISLGLRAGESFTAIAVRLGKAVSTISREVAGNGGRHDYRAWRAHRGGPGPIRKKPEQPTTQDTRIHDTIRAARRAPCAHSLNPPSRVPGDA